MRTRFTSRIAFIGVALGTVVMLASLPMAASAAPGGAKFTFAGSLS